MKQVVTLNQIQLELNGNIFYFAQVAASNLNPHYIYDLRDILSSVIPAQDIGTCSYTASFESSDKFSFRQSRTFTVWRRLLPTGGWEYSAVDYSTPAQ